MIHGGLIAFLMDEAMTCAVMAEGDYAATGELKLRYLKPVRSDPTAYIIVTVESRFRTMYTLSAKLIQGGEVRTRATARFIKQELKDIPEYR